MGTDYEVLDRCEVGERLGTAHYIHGTRRFVTMIADNKRLEAANLTEGDSFNLVRYRSGKLGFVPVED